MATLARSSRTTMAMRRSFDEIPEGPVTIRPGEAEKTYIEQVTEVDSALEEIRKYEKNVQCYSRSAIAITDAKASSGRGSSPK